MIILLLLKHQKSDCHEHILFAIWNFFILITIYIIKKNKIFFTKLRSKITQNSIYQIFITIKQDY